MAIISPVYATRPEVKSALDVKETARSNVQIDRLITASSRQIDQVCNRTFWPQLATRYFDWPTNYSGSGARPWQLWLDANELISVTSVVAGTTTIPLSNVLLEPVNYGPPYNRIEISLPSSSSFSGASTWQRAVAVTGLYGYGADESPGGTIVGSLTSSATTVTVSDSSLVAPGHIIRVDAERMIVSDAAMVAVAGQTLGGNLTAVASNDGVPVTNGSAFAVGETVLIDTERMLVVDITGNALVCKRAWDGTVLAAHTTSAAISALRSLTLLRSALGTTATSHLAAAPISVHVPYPQVRQACVGLTLYGLTTERGGLRPIPLTPASSDKSGSVKRTSSPVDAMLDDLFSSVGRKSRSRVI